MKEIPMSVIIPVSKDLRIKDCLLSIDQPVEIIVILNNQPTEEVIQIIRADKRCRLFYLEGRGCNLAEAFNLGIKSATNEKVVLTNSDCQFIPGLLSKFYHELDGHAVVKAQVDFEHGSYGQFLVAESRRLFHQVFDSGTKLFGPGLAFRKEIRSKIGGYFFDELMRWGEDGDLSKRIHGAKIDFLILDEKIIHVGENMLHDLRVAYKIGQGSKVKDYSQGVKLLAAFWSDLQHLTTDHHRQFKTAYQTGGCRLTLYFLLWKLIFHLGYYTKRHRKGNRNE